MGRPLPAPRTSPLKTSASSWSCRSIRYPPNAGRRKRQPADAEVDAAGKYVLPGLINAHAHTQEERGGVPQPLDYELKIWLSCGITTVRDVGSDTRKTLALRARSAAAEIAAPRFLVYPMFNSIQPAPPTPTRPVPAFATSSRWALTASSSWACTGISWRPPR